jgi:ribonuclease E
MALVGYEQEKIRIEAALANVRAQLGHDNPALTVAEAVAPKKRRMSAAAKRRIGEATRKRWQAFRAAKAEAEKHAAKPKRKLSAAGLRAIREATAKRWAAYRKAKKTAAKKTTPKTAAKKSTPKVKAPAAKTSGAAGTTA